MIDAPPGVLTCVYDGPAALARAVASDAEWLWLLAPGARPHGDALRQLLDAVEPEGAPRATVLAGVLADARGALLDDRVQPAPAIDTAAALRLVGQRLLPLRSAAFAHCLVARAAFERHGLPDAARFGPFAAEEWTARVLRTEPGYLVASSAIVLAHHAERAGRTPRALHLRATLRMLGTGTWTRGEAARALRRALTGS
jgi:hypothetical protein